MSGCGYRPAIIRDKPSANSAQLMVCLFHYGPGTVRGASQHNITIDAIHEGAPIGVLSPGEAAIKGAVDGRSQKNREDR